MAEIPDAPEGWTSADPAAVERARTDGGLRAAAAAALWRPGRQAGAEAQIGGYLYEVVDKVVSAILPLIAAQERAAERAAITADLQRAADGRRAYADAIDREELLAEANLLGAAAKLAGGDHNVMIALIPSWLWTDVDADRNPMPDLIPAGPPMREDPILSCVRCQDRPAAAGADFCRPCINEVVGRDEVTGRG